MDNARQAELVEQFMLAIAPEVIRFSMRKVRSSWLIDEGLDEQRRFMAQANAKMTLELAMYLAAQAGTLEHATKPAKKENATSEQIEAAIEQRKAWNAANPLP